MTRRPPFLLQVSQPIFTPRLMVRPFRLDDLDDLSAIESVPSLSRYLYREPRSRAETAGVLERKVRAVVPVEGGNISLAVCLGDRVVGDLTLIYGGPGHRQVEIGYVFHADFHGRGLATEAAAVLMPLAFTGLGAHRVFGRIDARNTASARVLEKLGFRPEAHLVENEWVKGEWTDLVIYGILDREWSARPPATTG